jgi:hypothetical protein
MTAQTATARNTAPAEIRKTTIDPFLAAADQADADVASETYEPFHTMLMVTLKEAGALARIGAAPDPTYQQAVSSPVATIGPLMISPLPATRLRMTG